MGAVGVVGEPPIDPPNPVLEVPPNPVLLLPPNPVLELPPNPDGVPPTGVPIVPRFPPCAVAWSAKGL